MSLGQSFAVALGATVALLVGVVLSGRAAKRRLHLPLVACAVVALVVTIVYAERFGSTLDLKVAEPYTSVHLALAKLAALAYLLPLASGIATLRNPRRRTLHGRIAYGVLALTGLTFVTGALMIAHAAPRAPGAEAGPPRSGGWPASTVEAAERAPAPAPAPEAGAPSAPE